ncbi:Acetyltransferase (GNAT) family protein [Falsiruegeria litorea R37]|uniref:Acetyltransferase (GNAT) family protein n=1 Tax=Falsiruegeria litorea R37 TaxID=1200284 RepID=A0A1Y5SYL3_9RHOB|nr:GNAT family N-acetyltransferase [Falsiruegeria litorea]SLN49472.1 Acetyltransferase (GNAT) family protein [Falsiruegeria litorea R37]
MPHEFGAVRRLSHDDPQIPQVLDLIRRSFAYMEGRIDPPSSMHRLTACKIANQCREGEVWVIGTPPVACVFLSPRADCLYLGKLAVDKALQGQGLARRLVEQALIRARDMKLPALELKTRIELTDNHKTFERLGFSVIGHDSHDGHARPTTVLMRRPVP